MCCNFVNTLFSRHERRSSMTGLAIGSIKARDEISEVVVFFSSSSSCSSSSSSGEDKTFMTRLLDTFVLVVVRVILENKIRNDCCVAAVLQRMRTAPGFSAARVGEGSGRRRRIKGRAEERKEAGRKELELERHQRIFAIERRQETSLKERRERERKERAEERKS